MHIENLGNSQFVFKEAQSEELLNEIFRLRFQVYCRERGFIREKDCPFEKESDEYDSYSLHFVAMNGEQNIIGAVRLILDSPLGFPLETRCQRLWIDKSQIPHENLGEISRLVISKLYRRRTGDGFYYAPQIEDSREILSNREEIKQFIRRIRPMAFGLYRELYQASKRKGIKYWYALMEESLARLLQSHGFTFRVVGEPIDYYGEVFPYFVEIEETEKEVYKKFPNFFDYFMEGMESELIPAFTPLEKATDEVGGKDRYKR